MQSRSDYDLPSGMRLNVHRFEPTNSERTGLTVLLLHGFLDSGATWDLVAEPLTRAGHEVLAPDLRGFGHSGRVGAGGYYHFPDYVGDVAALVDQIDRPRLALVGHSMGGTVAAMFAGAMPDRIERLVLLEGLGAIQADSLAALTRVRAWLQDMRKLETWQRPLASIEEAVERLARMHPSIPRDTIESRTRLLVHHVDDSGKVRWNYDPLHRTTSPMPFSIESFKGFLQNIKVPTLYVSGGNMGWRLPDEKDRLASIANVTHVDLPDAGHMMHWKAPEAVADCLLRFLAS